MAKKEFTATEVMMILERMEKQFRVFGEVQDALKNRVDAMFEMVGKNTEDIAMIKIDIVGIEKELKEINSKLEQKVDRAEYVRLERRVGVLERKLKIA